MCDAPVRGRAGAVRDRRSRPRGRAGRGHGVGSRAGRQRLLRRPGRRLSQDGSFLRSRAQAARAAEGLHEGRLPALHHPRPGRGPGGRHVRDCRRTAPSLGGDATDSGHQSAGSSVRRPAAPGLLRLCLPVGSRTGPGLRLPRHRRRRARRLPAVGPRQPCPVRLPVHSADRGQVDSGRALEAPGDPRLECRVRPLLAGAHPGAAQPAGARLRGLTALFALPAGPGGHGRAWRLDLHAQRPGVHRPAHHRCRHRHPQGRLPQRLPRPRRRDPDWDRYPGQ